MWRFCHLLPSIEYVGLRFHHFAPCNVNFGLPPSLSMPRYPPCWHCGGVIVFFFTGGKWKKILHGVIEKILGRKLNENSPILQGVNDYLPFLFSFSFISSPFCFNFHYSLQLFRFPSSSSTCSFMFNSFWSFDMHFASF
jgi:hypothetical protein